jgi:hypothetical protein
MLFGDIFDIVAKFHCKNSSVISEMDVTVIRSEWNNVKHAIFAIEAEEAGLEVVKYNGRHFYEGPAVYASRESEVSPFFSGKIQSDSMGRDVVVYPR